MDNRKRIAVDVDGTLTKKAAFPDIWEITNNQLWAQYENAEPNQKMIDWVNKKYDEGNLIYIFTSRNNLHQRVTKKWLDKHGVKYHYILMDKPYYDIIVDDKSLNLEDIQ